MITTKNTTTRKRRMGVGVHLNCKITEAKVKTLPSGRELIEVAFTNVHGEEQFKAIWIPDLNNLNVRSGESADEAKFREIKSLTDQALEITSAVLPLEEADVEANTITEFVKLLVKKLTNVKQTVNIVVQWDRNEEYTEIPRFGYIRKYVEGETPSFDLSKFRMTKSSDTSDNESEGGLPF